MENKLELKNLDACLETLNSRGNLPADLFLDYSSGDVWVPDYPKEHEYTVQFCPAVELVCEFLPGDEHVYTVEDVEEICQKAYQEFLTVL